jgi:hypothetical protein
MKNRTLALALAICCVSSLALADNPSDAPLLTALRETRDRLAADAGNLRRRSVAVAISDRSD